MARKLRKYVSIQSSGILHEFGGVSGPMLHPTWLRVDVIRRLLINGRIVYEHCITDPIKRVRLTLRNYDDFNIYPENSEMEDPSIDSNTYLISVKDSPVNESTMVTGNMYVEILQ